MLNEKFHTRSDVSHLLSRIWHMRSYVFYLLSHDSRLLIRISNWCSGVLNMRDLNFRLRNFT